MHFVAHVLAQIHKFLVAALHRPGDVQIGLVSGRARDTRRLKSENMCGVVRKNGGKREKREKDRERVMATRFGSE